MTASQPSGHEEPNGRPAKFLVVTYQPPKSGLLTWVPASWVPYLELARIDKPHGIYMIYYPNLVGVLYASLVAQQPIESFKLQKAIVQLFLYTILFRSAVCAWNDNIDQDYDRQTARCCNRAIARGAISTTQAHVYSAFLLAGALLILGDLSWECILCAGVSTTFGMIYPFGKRFTNFPQLILGFLLGSAIPLATFAVDENVLIGTRLWPTMSLCTCIVLLVVFYDVVYARQDIADDLKSGVKGMAVYFRYQIQTLLVSIVVGIAALLTGIGNTLELGPPFYALSAIVCPSVLLAMIRVVEGKLWPGLRKASSWFYVVSILSLIGGFSAEIFVSQ